MTHHELKCDLKLFTYIECGEKRAEFRKDDRGFEAGDTIRLWGWFRPPGGRAYRYSGHYIDANVTHVQRGGKYGIRAGYAMLSIEVTAAGVTTAVPYQSTQN